MSLWQTVLEERLHSMVWSQYLLIKRVYSKSPFFLGTTEDVTNNTTMDGRDPEDKPMWVRADGPT
eukprot:2098142-Prorocentrum_lima.AAC.1